MQTSIDQFLKIRKRPATDNVSVLTCRKLFAQDDGPCSPIKSPSRRIPVHHNEELKESVSDQLLRAQKSRSPVKCIAVKDSPRSATPVKFIPKQGTISGTSHSSSTTQEEDRSNTPDKSSATEELSKLTTTVASGEESKKLSTPEKFFTSHESVTSSISDQATQTQEPTTPSTPVRSPATQNKLMEQHGLGEFRKIIHRSQRFELMKARLSQLNSTKAELKKFDTIQLQIETSPVKCGKLKPRKLFGSEVSRSPKKNQGYISPRKLLDQGPDVTPAEPAYDRYKHLLAAGKESLPLPLKYAHLEKIFDRLDCVLRLMNQRGEVATFERIRDRMDRKFTEQHLRMIKAVYPESYELNYEKVRKPFSREEPVELVIKLPSGADLASRSNRLHTLLLDRTLEYHKKFLRTLDPPLDIPKERVTNWHPLFDLKNVPEIEMVTINRPATQNNAPVSVKEVLEKARQIMPSNKKIDCTLTKLNEQKTQEENKNIPELISRASSTPSALAAYQKALKGIPKSLLEKVRARKAAKMAEMITLTPAQAKEQIMLSRLPELAKALRGVFVNESKTVNVLPEDLVVKKVYRGYKEKLSREDLIEHMKMISKHVPGWLSFFTLRNEPYIRLSRDADFSRVRGKLENLAQSGS